MNDTHKRIWQKRLKDIITRNSQFQHDLLASMQSDLKLVYGYNLEDPEAKKLYKQIEDLY